MPKLVYAFTLIEFSTLSFVKSFYSSYFVLLNPMLVTPLFSFIRRRERAIDGLCIGLFCLGKETR